MSTSLRPHGLQHTRLPCPPLPPRVCSSSCPMCQWCYLTISSSAASFSFCLQSFQHQGFFQWVVSLHQVAKVLEFQLQPLVLPMNIQDWFPWGLTSLISLQSKGLSSVFSSTTIQKHQFFHAQPSLWSNSHIHILTKVIGNPLQYYCLRNTMDRGTWHATVYGVAKESDRT